MGAITVRASGPGGQPVEDVSVLGAFEREQPTGLSVKRPTPETGMCIAQLAVRNTSPSSGPNVARFSGSTGSRRAD